MWFEKADSDVKSYVPKKPYFKLAFYLEFANLVQFANTLSSQRIKKLISKEQKYHGSVS